MKFCVWSLLVTYVVTSERVSMPESHDIIKMRVISESVSLTRSNLIGGGNNHEEDDNLEDKLNTDTLPSNFTGSVHCFKDLLGQCFSLQKGGFEYRLCPFQNATQKEISYGFNRKRYYGLIGVWLEWIIEDFYLAGWKMENGDKCSDNEPRSTHVDFACGDSYMLYDVSEPKKCHYRMTFKLPQACHLDSLLVYPLLTNELRDAWDVLEGTKSSNEITSKGYLEELRKLLAASGLLQPSVEITERIINDVTSSFTAFPDNNIESISATGGSAANTLESTKSIDHSHIFSSLEKCQQAYDELTDAKERDI